MNGPQDASRTRWTPGFWEIAAAGAAAAFFGLAHIAEKKPQGEPAPMAASGESATAPAAGPAPPPKQEPAAAGPERIPPQVLPEDAGAPDAGAPKPQDRIVTVAPTPPAPPRDLKVPPPYEILDAHTFTSGDWTVSLADVEGPAPDAICYTGDRRLFACGLMARAALNNALRRVAYACNARRMVDAERIVADCRAAGGEDLAVVLIRAGWIKPVRGAPAEWEAARKAAEANSEGLWNGGWTLR